MVSLFKCGCRKETKQWLFTFWITLHHQHQCFGLLAKLESRKKKKPQPSSIQTRKQERFLPGPHTQAVINDCQNVAETERKHKRADHRPDWTSLRRLLYLISITRKEETAAGRFEKKGELLHIWEEQKQMSSSKRNKQKNRGEGRNWGVHCWWREW